MDLHATRTRRQLIVSAAATGGMAAVASLASRWAGVVDAAGGTAIDGPAANPLVDPLADPLVDPLVDPAAALVPAVRVPPPGLPFPVDVTGGGVIVLNNFRGPSNANGPCGHMGIDIGEAVVNEPGRPLLACVNGVIERDGVASSAGKFRILYGDDGRWYRYHHLDSYDVGGGEGGGEGGEGDVGGEQPPLAAGDRVVAGQQIGTMGMTGNTGWTHLHFEVWEGSVIPRDGTALDPVPLLGIPASVEVTERRSCDA